MALEETPRHDGAELPRSTTVENADVLSCSSDTLAGARKRFYGTTIGYETILRSHFRRSVQRHCVRSVGERSARCCRPVGVVAIRNAGRGCNLRDTQSIEESGCFRNWWEQQYL